MSIERIVLRTPAEPAQEIDDTAEARENLLNALPKELRDRWEEQTSALSDEDAVRALSEVVAKRREAQHADIIAAHDSSEDINTSAALALRERLTHNPQILGRGKVAEVLADPDKEDLCYKVVHDRSMYALSNPIKVEAQFLDELDAFSKAGIRTPKAFSIVVSPEFIALAMERLPGYSLEQLLSLPKRPSHFDSAAYFDAMETYFEALRERGIYHNDIRAGNLMFDPATGSGYVVDFGRAVHFSQDENGFMEFRFGNHLHRTRDHTHEKLSYIKRLIDHHFDRIA